MAKTATKKGGHMQCERTRTILTQYYHGDK